ncbi:hypothetical protein AV530_005638 [Patagioenas fasciata monilis]|uniref:Uncharacterized protein n=1 Tax=Patagioenas fasciata monilis TaxID=372326 RepID=A0A1V4JMI7_PATFA|nr:hypothetical protein AV530_005638 [Patagioenas fasciata monilis]
MGQGRAVPEIPQAAVTGDLDQKQSIINNRLLCKSSLRRDGGWLYIPKSPVAPAITGLNVLIVPSKQLSQMEQESFSRIFQISTDSKQFA